MPEPLNAGDITDQSTVTFQNRALFDMEFQIGGHRRRRTQRVDFPKIQEGLGKRVTQNHTRRVSDCQHVFQRQQARIDPRSHGGGTKAAAFLIVPDHKINRVLQLAS